MLNKRRIVTAGGTLLCALGVGYFMQMGAQPPAPSSVTAPMDRETPRQTADGGSALTQGATTPLTAPVLPATDISTNAASLVVPAQAEPPAPPSEPVVLAALTADETAQAPVQPAPEAPCGIEASAEPDAGAMVRLTVSAECRPVERLVVHHTGMMFSDMTDASGQLEIVVPALAEMAVFVVEFADGEGAVATAQVSSLPFYDRVVLQWAEDVSFQVHAREFGADYGSDGHVWSGSARDMTRAALGQGGFLTTLGNPDVFTPRLAEVYTFPTATAAQSGTVSLTVETEITAANCDRLIEAQALELRSEGELRTRDLSLNMPGCEAIGDFLVLNNLMEDLTIAAK